MTTRGSNGHVTKIKCLDCGQETEIKKNYGTKDQDTCPHINTTQRDSNRKEHIVTCMDCGKVLSKTSAEEWKDRKHLGAQVSQANRETAETIARTITNEDQTLTVEQAKQVTNVFAASVSAYEERTRKLVEKVKTSRAKDKMHVDQTIDMVTFTSMFQDSVDVVMKQPQSSPSSSGGHRAHMFTVESDESFEENICIDKPVPDKRREKDEKYARNLQKFKEYGKTVQAFDARQHYIGGKPTMQSKLAQKQHEEEWKRLNELNLEPGKALDIKYEADYSPPGPLSPSLSEEELSQPEMEESTMLQVLVHQKTLELYQSKLAALVRETNAETLEEFAMATKQLRSESMQLGRWYTQEEYSRYSHMFRESVAKDHEDATSCAKSVLRGIVLRAVSYTHLRAHET